MFLTAISCDMPRSVSSLLMVNNYDSYVAAIKCDIGDSGGCGVVVVVVVCCFWFLMVNYGDDDGDGDSDVKTHCEPSQAFRPNPNPNEIYKDYKHVPKD